jgi:hypothetical protein
MFCFKPHVIVRAVQWILQSGAAQDTHAAAEHYPVELNDVAATEPLVFSWPAEWK